MRGDVTVDLSDTECRSLRRAVGMMIPASEEHDVPGADDAIIFADILRSLGRDVGDVRAALADLSEIGGGDFAGLDEPRAERALETVHARGGGAAAVLGRLVLQCYYRDDRVLRSIGMEPRAPFPQGHTLEQGDWSLLDAVRGRPQLWRDDRRL